MQLCCDIFNIIGTYLNDDSTKINLSSTCISARDLLWDNIEHINENLLIQLFRAGKKKESYKLAEKFVKNKRVYIYQFMIELMKNKEFKMARELYKKDSLSNINYLSAVIDDEELLYLYLDRNADELEDIALYQKFHPMFVIELRRIVLTNQMDTFTIIAKYINKWGLIRMLIFDGAIKYELIENLFKKTYIYYDQEELAIKIIYEIFDWVCIYYPEKINEFKELYKKVHGKRFRFTESKVDFVKRRKMQEEENMTDLQDKIEKVFPPTSLCILFHKMKPEKVPDSIKMYKRIYDEDIKLLKKDMCKEIEIKDMQLCGKQTYNLEHARIVFFDKEAYDKALNNNIGMQYYVLLQKYIRIG